MALYTTAVNHDSLKNNQQLQIDLDKLQSNLAAKLLQLLANESITLYVAMFNGHAIASLTVKSVEQNKQLIIEDFIVRASTRRRGVGLFLFSEVFEIYKKQQNWHWIIKVKPQPDNNLVATAQTMREVLAEYTLFIAHFKQINPNTLLDCATESKDSE